MTREETELNELFDQLRAAGWKPMLCDTKVPVYDNAVSCGAPEDIGDINRDEEWYPHEMLPPFSIYKLPAKGDSMRDADIHAGDMLTIERDVRVMDSDMVLVRLDDEFLVKAYYEDDDGSKWLVPFNDKYEPIRLNGEKRVYICGKVIEVSKRYPRVTHRDTSRIVHNSRRRNMEVKMLSNDEKMAVIQKVAPMVEIGRQWFSVYHAFEEKKQLPKGDYSGFCTMVREAVPEHEHLPVALEIERMNTLSFTKAVVLWDPSDAPVRGVRFVKYKVVAQQTLDLIAGA